MHPISLLVIVLVVSVILETIMYNELYMRTVWGLIYRPPNPWLVINTVCLLTRLLPLNI